MNLIGLRRMLSEQFRWRQKAAERRCRIADATIAIVVRSYRRRPRLVGTGTGSPNSAAVSDLECPRRRRVLFWIGPEMGMQDIITTKLIAAFAPESLHVEDESHLHEGHAGHRPGGETHFRLYIVAQAFRGKTRLERHRMINAALANELKGRVHALAIHAAAPEETV
jgi:BolA protein